MFKIEISEEAGKNPEIIENRVNKSKPWVWVLWEYSLILTQIMIRMYKNILNEVVRGKRSLETSHSSRWVRGSMPTCSLLESNAYDVLK